MTLGNAGPPLKLTVYTERPDEKLYFERFGRQFGVELVERTEDPAVDTAHFAGGAPCVTIITTLVDAVLLEAFRERGVRFISTRSIGTDHIDLQAAARLGIRVGNVSYDPDAVSNYTVMLILMAIRQVKNIARLSVAGDFSLRHGVQGRNLRNLTVGVAGTGRIGKRVIEHLSSFGCPVLVYSHRRSLARRPGESGQEDVLAQKHARYVDWDEFLASSDIISLHLHPTPETYHIINRDAIARMKDGVILVNTARGGLVDSEALIEAVENGKVSGAALDVHEDELSLYYKDLRGQPLSNRSLAVLRSFPNVIVTPHTAFYTDQTVSDMVENTIRSCLHFANSESNPWEVPLPDESGKPRLNSRGIP
ncbi:MAG: D-lactate dehydrogenase VanH-A [Spirochaetaceae bacterium]|jgi:D-lactate dehydrogenase|nr:D-lactate dehydrogenase VanH-A [Spirochaetaceae bacterium]